MGRVFYFTENRLLKGCPLRRLRFHLELQFLTSGGRAPSSPGAIGLLPRAPGGAVLREGSWGPPQLGQGPRQPAMWVRSELRYDVDETSARFWLHGTCRRHRSEAGPHVSATTQESRGTAAPSAAAEGGAGRTEARAHGLRALGPDPACGETPVPRPRVTVRPDGGAPLSPRPHQGSPPSAHRAFPAGLASAEAPCSGRAIPGQRRLRPPDAAPGPPPAPAPGLSAPPPARIELGLKAQKAASRLRAKRPPHPALPAPPPRSARPGPSHSPGGTTGLGGGALRCWSSGSPPTPGVSPSPPSPPAPLLPLPSPPLPVPPSPAPPRPPLRVPEEPPSRCSLLVNRGHFISARWLKRLKSLSRVRLYLPVDCILPSSSVRGMFLSKTAGVGLPFPAG